MAHVTTYPHIGDVSQARPSFRRDLGAAIITGQLAGLIMAVVVMAVFTIFLGKGPLYPVQVIGSFVFGDAGLQGFHLGAFLAGLILHQLGPALFWSIPFGLVVHFFHIRTGMALVLLGAATGLLSQIVDVNLILPPVMNALHGHDIWAEQVPAFWSWAAHLVYGLSLAIFPKVYHRLERNAG